KGQSLFMLVPQSLRVRYEQVIARYMESDRKRPQWHGVEIKGQHKNGHEILLEVSFGEFNLKSQRFFTGFMRDITQRKKLESVLKSTERLTVIGRLAASIAHEINNPLDAIKNIFYLLHDCVTPEQAAQIKIAEQELNKITEIIRRTLGFARETPALSEIEINTVLDETIELLSRKIQQKNISIQKRYRLQTPVTANSGEMRQIFVNLIANALDAMSLNGHISLRTYLNRSFFGSKSAAI